LRLIHLSDVHVQIDYTSLPLRRLGWRRTIAQIEMHWLRRASLFERAAETLHQIALDADRLGADHVLLSGDLTGLAYDEEFAEVLAALGPLARDPKRLSIVPGNHDRYTAHSVRDRRFERYLGHLLQSDLPQYCGKDGYPFVRLVGDQLAVVGLDSTRLAPFPGLVFGSLGADQLHRLEALLADPALKGRGIAVMLHHAPLARWGGTDTVTHGLWDARRLLHVLEGRSCALHFGHIHQRYWHRATEHHPHLFSAGSSTMLGDEGYWLVDWEGGCVASARVMRPGEPLSKPSAPQPEEPV
jgi:3',5'-cyclic AMP phosphodiesterase CpdA